MNFSEIRTQLITTLNAATSLAVKVDGENFTPKSTSDFPFARFTFMPNETVKRSLGNSGVKELAGLAQIDIYYTRSINSATEAFIKADEIVNAFAPQTFNLASGKLVVEMAWFEAAKQEASAIGIPVYVRWTAYQT